MEQVPLLSGTSADGCLWTNSPTPMVEPNPMYGYPTKMYANEGGGGGGAEAVVHEQQIQGLISIREDPRLQPETRAAAAAAAAASMPQLLPYRHPVGIPVLATFDRHQHQTMEPYTQQQLAASRGREALAKGTNPNAENPNLNLKNCLRKVRVGGAEIPIGSDRFGVGARMRLAAGAEGDDVRKWEWPGAAQNGQLVVDPKRQYYLLIPMSAQTHPTMVTMPVRPFAAPKDTRRKRKAVTNPIVEQRKRVRVIAVRKKTVANK